MPSIFGGLTTSIGFDIVIGNPPYGTSIKGEYRAYVMNKLGKVPDYEMYYYFIEAAKPILKARSVLNYIIPNTILFNVYATNYRVELLDRWNVKLIVDCTEFDIFNSATVKNILIFFENNTVLNPVIGYKSTIGAEDYQDLLLRPTLFLEKADIKKVNHNWGLAFKLPKEKLLLALKISAGKKSVADFFTEISQGLIAYDKYRGQSEEIIKSRAYHFSSSKKGLKPWLWGEDVTKYKLKWNEKEWINYCDGIANPRDPKFFIGPRVLVREITNPSVFAAYTDIEAYNDPAIIIVKPSSTYNLFVLLALLNSKLASFFHFNFSPKSTKGAFPKILVTDIRNFPLPECKKQMAQTIEDKVREIFDDYSKLGAILSEIDLLVYKLFDLTFDEAGLIEGNANWMNRKDYNNLQIK